MLAAAGARSLAGAIDAGGVGASVARGHICVHATAAGTSQGPLEAVRAATAGFGALAVVHSPASCFQELLEGHRPLARC